jgi:hypothetical protein
MRTTAENGTSSEVRLKEAISGFKGDRVSRPASFSALRFQPSSASLVSMKSTNDSNNQDCEIVSQPIRGSLLFNEERQCSVSFCHEVQIITSTRSHTFYGPLGA